MYAIITSLQNHFYPEHEKTATSSRMHYVTPSVKAMLRRKNHLMHAGRVNEGNALATHVNKITVRKSSKWLRKASTREGTKDASTKVKEVL